MTFRPRLPASPGRVVIGLRRRSRRPAALLDHARAQSTADVLAASRWDVVVLQEQSEIPSVEYMRQSSMYPAARDLVAMARGVGAKPMFFLTWGHRLGWPESESRITPACNLPSTPATCSSQGSSTRKWPRSAPPGLRWRAWSPLRTYATEVIRPARERTWRRASFTLRSSNRARLVLGTTHGFRAARPLSSRMSPRPQCWAILPAGACRRRRARACNVSAGVG